MSKMNFSKGKFSSFMASKGFYIAIVVCLVGAGAATWMAVNRTIGDIENANSQIIEKETLFNDFPSLEEVEKKQPDIPKVDAPSSSSAPTLSSSPEPSAKPVDESIEPEASQTLAELPRPVYALPMKGDIISQFSNGELVKNKTLKDWRTHDGIDIACEKGSDILAAADGVVEEIKKDPLWGNVIVLRHPDSKLSYYCGVSEIIPVKVGENVTIKQVIGTLESVPCEISEDPHLHFAVKEDGVWINPLLLVAKAD